MIDIKSNHYTLDASSSSKTPAACLWMIFRKSGVTFTSQQVCRIELTAKFMALKGSAFFSYAIVNEYRFETVNIEI